MDRVVNVRRPIAYPINRPRVQKGVLHPKSQATFGQLSVFQLTAFEYQKFLYATRVPQVMATKAIANRICRVLNWNHMPASYPIRLAKRQQRFSCSPVHRPT
jgi:hypothetical protein